MNIHEKKLLDTNKYLLDELQTLKEAMEKINQEYAKSGHMDRIGMATSKDNAESMYYHFWMICNDLGII